MSERVHVAISGSTSVDKALEICEALSGQATSLSLSDLARSLDMPPPTVHRLLSILKHRGYVRQDDETAHYRLTLKVLDLGFRLLGRSELKLHAYPVLREYTLRARAALSRRRLWERSPTFGVRGPTRSRCTRPMVKRCRRTARCTSTRATLDGG